MIARLRIPYSNPAVAVGALDPSPRALMASAGPSDARTQEGGKGSALAPTEDAAARRDRRRQRRARTRGEGTQKHKKKGHKKKGNGKKHHAKSKGKAGK
jgi:hypothetical protein